MQGVHFIDTHAHMHSADFPMDEAEALQQSAAAGVTRVLAIGTSVTDSRLAVASAQRHKGVSAVVGIHPHEAQSVTEGDLQELDQLAQQPGVVGIGEVGFDLFYNNSDLASQERVLRAQLLLAQKYKLPLSLHIRSGKSSQIGDDEDAFAHFWRILGDFELVGGVMHSFSANKAILGQILDHGFHVGLNGIMTFAKDQDQLEAAKAVPLGKMMLETDAPFLTPTPYRGKTNRSTYIVDIAKFLAELRGESLEEIAAATTANATKLFKL